MTFVRQYVVKDSTYTLTHPIHQCMAGDQQSILGQCLTDSILQSLYVLRTTVRTTSEVAQPKVWGYIKHFRNIYGVCGSTPNLQNYLFKARKPVHKAMKEVLGSSMGQKHISAPDGHFRRPTLVVHIFLLFVLIIIGPGHGLIKMIAAIYFSRLSRWGLKERHISVALSNGATSTTILRGPRYSVFVRRGRTVCRSEWLSAGRHMSVIRIPLRPLRFK